MFIPKAAAARLAASIKASFIAGFDRLQRSYAKRMRGEMMASIIKDRIDHHTPGAFGRASTPTRYRGPGGGLWRRNAASGKVRGY
jgi:hypothetical protein